MNTIAAHFAMLLHRLFGGQVAMKFVRWYIGRIAPKESE